MATTHLYCTACGAANEQQDAFCFACGKPLKATASLKGYPKAASVNSNKTGLLTPNHLLRQRYRILTRLGKGGFGAVYKAEDTQFGNRLVAVKEMSQSGLGSQQEINEAAKAFEHEAFLLANLRHQNLPRIYDHFSDSGRWYLVMDFIEGETLQEHLDKARGSLPLEQVRQVGIQLCTVLNYLHTRQPPIIFRDLKPDNIMITPDGHIYLIDFGIARLFKPGQSKDTTSFGSPGYASPEQYGKKQTTPRSDIYSLGATLHHLLTGIDPSQNPFQFLPPQLSRHDIPLSLSTLIMQMLEMDESKRPASTTIIKDALQRSSTDLPSKTPLPPTQPVPTHFSGETSPFPISFPTRNVKALVIIAAIIVVVGVAAFSIAPLLHPSSQPSSNSKFSSSGNNPASAATAAVPTPVLPTSAPSPTPQPGPGTVLCQADASHGWNGWNGTSDWKILNGVLISNGSYNITEGPPTIVAPCPLGSIANYAVEAQIQVLKNSYPTCFGIDVRGTPTANGWQGYVGTVYVACNNGNNLLALNTDNMNNVNLTSAPFNPGTGFHTYRVEVKDNELHFLIDGAELLSVTDNTYTSGEQVGLWSYDAQLNVSSFKIIAL